MFDCVQARIAALLESPEAAELHSANEEAPAMLLRLVVHRDDAATGTLALMQQLRKATTLY